MDLIEGTVLQSHNRETMPYDVVIVGGGPAGLSTALHIKQQSKKMGRDVSVCLVEKSATAGGHILSGAVIDPVSLDALLPDWRTQGCPLADNPVTGERFIYLTKRKHIGVPYYLLPPMMHNKGFYIGSLGALCRWLTKQAEEAGVDVFPATSAAGLTLGEKGECTGIITGDMGVNKRGEKKPQFTEGIAIKARYTVLAEGARGSLSKRAIKHFSLREGRHQTYALGLKEVWEIPKTHHKRGHVVHTVGWPLDRSTHGGGFLYHWGENWVSVGLVVHLDYRDPTLSPFDEFQQMKTHPFFASLLRGGKRMSYGARVIATGGHQSLPQLTFPGGLLVGCAAGLVNVPRIKGTHNAIESGMQAAHSLVEAFSQDLKQKPSFPLLQGYQERYEASSIHKELYRVRNIKPLMARFGLVLGMLLSGVEMWLRAVGLGLPGTLKHHKKDRAMLVPLDAKDCHHRVYPQPDGVLSFDRTSSVYLSGTNHQEDEPSHLRLKDKQIPISNTLPKFGEPSRLYCPAGVYEVVDEGKKQRFHINAQNCIHCKTCDIKDPADNIEWVVPEGGGGPNYVNM